MDRIIKDRRRQNSQMNQIIKMQNLLEQYDRENEFLNKQVNNLLRENIKLKMQVGFQPYNDSKFYVNESFSRKKSKQKLSNHKQSKTYQLSQPRKSRYSYVFDENQLRNLKTNIKKQLKKDALKQTSTKQVQTLTQSIPHFKPLTKQKQQTKQTQKIKSIAQTFKNIKLYESKSTLIKPFSHLDQQQLVQVHKTSPSRSKSKERQKSQQKMQVISKSKVYQKPKQQDKQQNSKLHNLQRVQVKNIQPILSKQSFSNKQDILEQSFGVPHKAIQKKGNIAESSNLPLTLKQAQNKHQIITKLIPLTKNESRSALDKDQMIKIQQKSERKHSLNPSPKLQINPFLKQNTAPKTKPFILKTQEAIPQSSIQFHKNPSQKIKRKFIKVVSNKKVSAQKSPKKTK